MEVKFFGFFILEFNSNYSAASLLHVEHFEPNESCHVLFVCFVDWLVGWLISNLVGLVVLKQVSLLNSPGWSQT